MKGDKTTHSARANKWTARILEARAAIYAASLAKYNNLLTTRSRQAGMSRDTSRTRQRILQYGSHCAKDVIENSPYVIQDNDPDKGKNFYNAICIKDNNTEVMWAHDYYYLAAP
jgi:hypothetical protein